MIDAGNKIFAAKIVVVPFIRRRTDGAGRPINLASSCPYSIALNAATASRGLRSHPKGSPSVRPTDRRVFQRTSIPFVENSRQTEGADQ